MTWLRKYWWTLVAGLALVVGFMVRGMFGKKEDGVSFADMAKEEADSLQKQIDAKKAEAKAETDAQMAELKKIEATQNDAERRKKLAAFLDGLR